MKINIKVQEEDLFSPLPKLPREQQVKMDWCCDSIAYYLVDKVLRCSPARKRRILLKALKLL
jgi:hypothetical protein